MRILLFGKNGQVGWELQRCLPVLGEVVALDIDELNLAQSEKIAPRIREVRPDVIVNASAYTAVDRAEEEPERARLVNAIAPGIMAAEARVLDAVLIHYSTDYVFDGEKGAPYIEDDEPNPINVYGSTKLEGEIAIQEVDGIYFIFRTSWVYSMRSNSFPIKVLRWAREREDLRVVDDQVGSPTWARMLAEITAIFLAHGKGKASGWFEERKGIYHLAGKGSVSRFDWAKQILRNDLKTHEHFYKNLLPASSVDFPTPARRPAYSSLDCGKFTSQFNINLPIWTESLSLAMESGSL